MENYLFSIEKSWKNQGIIVVNLHNNSGIYIDIGSYFGWKVSYKKKYIYTVYQKSKWPIEKNSESIKWIWNFL